MPSRRDLPSIDTLLRSSALAPTIARHGVESVKERLRALQSRWRASGELPPWAADPDGYRKHLDDEMATGGYRPVFNLTGTIIHTNLGRAPLGEALLNSVIPLVSEPMNLEYDLAEGTRGDRDAVIEARLRVLTGAEAATIVNNNAAAITLCLNTFALGRAVIVSRGELIEIGGSFRLPELMERAGCRLREVGTTNRTHLEDYRNAIDERTAMLLKVHPSNYRISGFTRDVGVAELAGLAREHELPLCVDLGSGTLVDMERWGLPHEPMPQEILHRGADLVTFSGDKLLGSAQAGIILGRREHIGQIKTNPLKRALRPDKVTLAILEATLRLYEEPTRLREQLPVLRWLTAPMEQLDERARAVERCLQTELADFHVEVAPGECQFGSGSLPEQTVPSRAVRITHSDSGRVRQLEMRLRRLSTPIIGRVQRNALWLDMRGAERLERLLETLQELSAAS